MSVHNRRNPHPSGVGGRVFDLRAFGALRFAVFLVVDFGVDLPLF
jgi:hypothetical protein